MGARVSAGWRVSIAVVSSLAVWAVAERARVAAQAGTPAPAPVYAADIQPILEQHCYECHGPNKSKGSLRLDLRARAFKGGVNGPAIVAGDAEHSLLLRRLQGLDGEDQMPLKKDPLPAETIARIRAWIQAGAVWPEQAQTAAADATHEHWAYQPPVRPALPAVKNESWVRTPIDRFVLARLEHEGLSPSPEAAKDALLRRVSLDLIGLPPTPQELDAFMSDAKPDAYERAVDRLLASRHYGERWARPWLDLARYADSNGYEKDDLRVMWPYRDWLIDALNRDMPFDEFTIEQIAGDMLPAPTDAQRIATGFHRNTLLNQEGGIDVEEARWETLVDRVSTTGTVWLGTTIGCAQCHNHKYDPFSQRDFYRMLAFFDNGDYSVFGEQGGDHYISEPELDLPTPEQAAQRKVLQAQLDELKAQMSAQSPERTEQQSAWEQSIRAAEQRWTVLTPLTSRASQGTILTTLPDGSVRASGPSPLNDTYVVKATLPATAISAIRLEALPDKALPQGGPGRDYYGNFALTGFTVAVASSPSAASGAPLVFEKANDNSHVGGNEANQLVMPDAETKNTRDLPPGWSINATNDVVRHPRAAVFKLKAPLDPTTGTAIVTLTFKGIAVSQALGRFRLSVTSDPDPFVVTTVGASTRAALDVAPEARTEEQRDAVRDTFRDKAPVLEDLRTRITELEDKITAIGITKAQVLHERNGYERPSTWFRVRGSYMAKGDRVYAGTPAVLPPMPDDQMPNRLGLARWLVSGDNPLTARVEVNRAWEQFFGRGIVETSEDFGTQGAQPSHPELLDWLATELERDKWSVKALHRLIVTSATYRQSASASPELIERDPYNRLLARGPRFRLEAETLRDSVLSASGLLSPAIGGPSVFPPQPDGIWDNPYSDAKWVTSTGPNRYRRSLYTFIRRTAPYPSMIAFDGTSREFCTVRRVRTNTPLQALVLLNDEAFFEAARALAARILRETPQSASGTNADAIDRARAAYGFRLCTSRQPSPAEIDRIIQSLRKQQEHFKNAPAAGAQVLGESSASDATQADRAAWTLVANALLNLDETVTK